MTQMGENSDRATPVCSDCGKPLADVQAECLACAKEAWKKKSEDDNPFIKFLAAEAEQDAVMKDKKWGGEPKPFKPEVKSKPQPVLGPVTKKVTEFTAKSEPVPDQYGGPKEVKKTILEAEPIPFGGFKSTRDNAPPVIKPPSKMRPAVYSVVAVLLVVIVAIALVKGLERPISGVTNEESAAVADVTGSTTEAGEVEIEIMASLGDEKVAGYEDFVASGKEHALRGEWTDAIASFEKGLALRNDDVPAIRNLVRAYIETDNVESALFHIRRWIELNTGDPEPYAIRGSIYLGDGDYEDAREEYVNARETAGFGDQSWDDYADKIEEIDTIIAENKRLSEQSKVYDANDGWQKVEKPVLKPKVAPKPVVERTSIEESPITKIIEKYDGSEDEEELNGSVVLIGGDDEDSDVEISDDTEVEGEELLEKLEVTEPVEPEHVKITGAKYDSGASDFSLYLDTNVRATPKAYYDEANLILWLTVPNAECDFDYVPREKAFTHVLVKSIRTWVDGDSIRLKIILKKPILPLSPSVMALGISLHMTAKEDEPEDVPEDEAET